MTTQKPCVPGCRPKFIIDPPRPGLPHGVGRADGVQHAPGCPAEIDNIFSYHAPKGDQPQRYDQIRTAAKAFAHVLIENTPPSADQSAALRKLRECVMTANASIALESAEG